MKELAKATRRVEGKPEPAIASRDGTSLPGTAPTDQTAAPSPITSQPQTPAADVSRVEEFLWQLGRPRTIVGGVILVVILGIVIIMTSGPRFVDEPHPVSFQGEVRPLPIEPNAPLTTVFAVLGTRAPRAHPDAPQLARYSYGENLVVDALNGRVYAITFSVPNRTWRGLRIGASRQAAEGALALLATPRDHGVEAPVSAQPRDGYATYPSRDSLPTQTLIAAVRPPNGCFDAQVQLQPKISGLLIDGDRRYAVVGREGAAVQWVVTRIRIVSRAVPGPYAAAIAC